MRCVRLARVVPLLTAAVASVVAARATPAAVQLSVSSATVAQAGDSGRICVALSTSGEEVAGTENRLVWDGSCATLSEAKSTCYAAGSHGKQLNWTLTLGADFTMKALVLSLSDVDPIDDGFLYCCNFQGEAAAGSCCSITVVAPGASDSKGNAISSVLGSSGSICTAPARSSGGGPIGRVDPSRPLSATNAGAPVDDSRLAAGAGAVAPGGAAAPPVQVLQGGGAVAPTAAPEAAEAPGAAPADAAAAAAAPSPAAPSPAVAPPATVAAAPVPAVAASPAAAIQVPTAAVSASAAPTAADTPTAAVPTAVATKGAPAAAGSAPAAAAPAASRGWFGCQIGGGSAAPVFALGLLFAAVAWVRRRSTPHR